MNKLKAKNLNEFDQNLHRSIRPNKDHVIIKRPTIKSKNEILLPENMETSISFGIVVATAENVEHLKVGDIVYTNYRGIAYPLRDIIKGDRTANYFQTSALNLLGHMTDEFELEVDFEEK